MTDKKSIKKILQQRYRTEHIYVNGCARCGKNHKTLLFKPFAYPVLLESVLMFTHWAMCPRRKEPLLMRIE
jgi:hypothetical protein